MQTKPQTKKAKILELKRKLECTEAAQVYRLHHASYNLTEKLKGGAVILSIKSATGAVIVDPVLISSGLSIETIAALKLDLQRSFVYDTELKP